jgi:hypothetical protein
MKLSPRNKQLFMGMISVKVRLRKLGGVILEKIGPYENVLLYFSSQILTRFSLTSTV